ncbi:hypothetical protein V2G26_012286 [Clonostachys chloroleuca]
MNAVGWIIISRVYQLMNIELSSRHKVLGGGDRLYGEVRHGPPDGTCTGCHYVSASRLRDRRLWKTPADFHTTSSRHHSRLWCDLCRVGMGRSNRGNVGNRTAIQKPRDTW